MKTIKLIVTHKENLLGKYGEKGLAKIDKAIASLVKKDDARNMVTHYVHLDDAKEMKQYKAKAVTGQATAIKCKKGVDALFKALSPDYLVLLGADDVIPYFMVDNPSFDGDADDDKEVPTDNPYACSRAFSKKNRKSYLIPDRVVGRIPDLPESDDPSWLLDYLKVAESWQLSTDPKDFEEGLFVCCEKWENSGKACVEYLSRPAKRLMISPPTLDKTKSLRGRHPTRLHMIKCHGAPRDASFYGEKKKAGGPGEDFPAILVSTSLLNKTTKGTVVGAMCCYGGAVFDPNAAGVQTKGAPPIPSVYLKQGAYGFAGSTTIAWVGFDIMLCADWVIAAFLKGVMQGASLGRALLEAKQGLMRFTQQQGETPDIAEDKTMLQFHLLGDPSIHVVPIVKPAPAALRAATARGRTATAAAMGPSDERRARRAFQHKIGKELRGALPEREQVGVPAPTTSRATRAVSAARRAVADAQAAAAKVSPAVAKRFKEISKEMGGMDVKQPIVHKVTRTVAQPELVAANRPRGLATARIRESPPIAQQETFEYYWIERKRLPNSPIINARMVKVETDQGGNVIRSRVLVSS